MKNFFKKLTIIFSVFVLTFISLVSFKTFNNTNDVMAYTSCSQSPGYPEWGYGCATYDVFNVGGSYDYGSLDNVNVSTFLDGSTSYGSKIYINGVRVSSYSSLISNYLDLSVGSHSFCVDYAVDEDRSTRVNYSYTINAVDTYYLSWQKTNNLITLNYNSSTSQTTLKSAFISAFKNNITSVYVINQDSDVIYTLTSSDINNLNYTDITGSTFYYGNETNAVSFGIGFNYNGHSLVNLTLENQPYKWYYDAPPTCTPYLTISISNGLELLYSSATISENDLISELISHNDGFIGSYTNSSCVAGNIDVSTAVVDLVDYIQLLVGNNTIQFNVSYNGLSLTKNINVVLLPSSGGIEQDYFNLKDMFLFIMSTPITLISGIFDFTIFGFNIKNLLFVLFSVAIIVFVISFLKGKRGD